MGKLKKKKSIIGIVLVLVLILLVVGGIILVKKNKSKNSVKSYTTVQVKKPAPFVATGKINASRTQQILLPQGKVQQVLVKNGTQVTEGQQLVTTYSQAEQNDIDDLNQEIAQQQRKVTSTQRQLNYLKNNNQPQTNTGEEEPTDSQEQIAEAQDTYNDATATLSSLQTKLQKAQNRLNNSATAPFSGVAQVSYGQTGKPNIIIYANDLEFQANVSEYDYAHLKKNTIVKVTALASKEQAETKIDFISNEPSSASKANEAKYKFTAPLSGNFMNGQTARASVEQEGFSIPASSVQKGGVYVVNKDNRVSFRHVMGKSQNGYFKVDAGLHLKQKVITNPDKKLQNGNKVKTND